jgi:hypothetical protein
MQQMTGNTYLQDADEEQFSFRNLLIGWRRSLQFALGNWRIILIVSIVGGLLGLAYAWIKQPTYAARLTFVVEESKSGGSSVASALAGQIGIDIGSLTGGGGGILAGDNVLELLKSRSFIKKTLLTGYRDSGSNFSLADQYAEVYGWKENWKNNSEVGKQINFPVGQERFTRVEDSLLQVIISRLTEKEVAISKPDKKLSFFELTVNTRDERVSQLFCERLLKITADFYVETKTRRIVNNVNRLQRRADSLGGLLDRRTVSSAETERLLLDANPAYSGPVANAEISSRNKLIQGTVYAEIIKNLEISRTALMQETPTVQVVDYPELPLKKNKISKRIALLMGMIIGAVATVLLLAITVSPQPAGSTTRN